MVISYHNIYSIASAYEGKISKKQRKEYTKMGLTPRMRERLYWIVSPGHLGCSGLFIYLLRFKDYHCVLGKDLYDRIELRAGAPLTLNLVTSWFGGMTSFRGYRPKSV